MRGDSDGKANRNLYHQIFEVKRNFDRVSLLQRLEDYPYLRDDSDVHSPHSQVTSAGGCQSQVPQFNLSDDERNRLLKLISGNSGLAGMERVQIQHPNSQQQHLVVQHQIPSTSSYSTQNSFMYLKSDGQYTALKTDSQQQSQQQQQQQQQQSQSFEATVNSVAHAQTLEEMQNMQSMDVIRELFPTGNGASPAQGEVLRRKQPNRRPEESCKATCKICGHDVMYSPQRTWNLMRHVWIMHQSSKPNQCSACGYSHIKPYVRKHIESQHKQQNATILDLKSPELEAEWSALLDQCFGVTYRKWKHRKDENHVVQDDHSSQFGQDHFSTHQSDVMTNL